MNRHILLTCTALAMFSTHAHAALITGGVYDENVFRTNVVDTSATSDVGNQVSLTTFKSLITTAFADGTGGVAHFDGATDTTGALAAPGGSFTITYGPAQSLSINVVNGTPTLMNVGGPGSGRTTISGSSDFPTGRALSKSGGAGADDHG